MKQPSFQEELAAHLEGQKQPLPHPSQRYTIDHAAEAMRLDDVRFKLLNDIRAPYIDPVKEARLKKLAADVDLQHARLREMGIHQRQITGHVPITMHEPRIDWLGAIMVITAAVSAASSLLIMFWPDVLEALK